MDETNLRRAVDALTFYYNGELRPEDRVPAMIGMMTDLRHLLDATPPEVRSVAFRDDDWDDVLSSVDFHYGEEVAP